MNILEQVKGVIENSGLFFFNQISDFCTFFQRYSYIIALFFFAFVFFYFLSGYGISFFLAKEPFSGNKAGELFEKVRRKMQRFFAFFGVFILANWSIGNNPQILYFNPFLYHLHRLIGIATFTTLLFLIAPLLSFSFLFFEEKWQNSYEANLGVFSIFKGIIRGLAYFFVFFFASNFFLINQGRSLLTHLSIGLGTLTAIVGLASKDFIANFFGSLMIVFGRFFEIGDTICINKIKGRVIAIDMRSTKLRASDGRLIYIPNGVFSQKNFENYGPFDPLHFSIHIPMEKKKLEEIQDLVALLKKLFLADPMVLSNASSCHLSIDHLSKGRLDIQVALRDESSNALLTYCIKKKENFEKIAKEMGVSILS